MSDIEIGLLDAQDHFLRGVSAGNKSFAKIGGQELRKGNPATINKYRENLGKIEKLSKDVEEKLAAAHANKDFYETQNKNRK